MIAYDEWDDGEIEWEIEQSYHAGHGLDESEYDPYYRQITAEEAREVDEANRRRPEPRRVYAKLPGFQPLKRHWFTLDRFTLSNRRLHYPAPVYRRRHWSERGKAGWHRFHGPDYWYGPHRWQLYLVRLVHGEPAGDLFLWRYPVRTRGKRHARLTDPE